MELGFQDKGSWVFEISASHMGWWGIPHRGRLEEQQPSLLTLDLIRSAEVRSRRQGDLLRCLCISSVRPSLHSSGFASEKASKRISTTTPFTTLETTLVSFQAACI